MSIPLWPSCSASRKESSNSRFAWGVSGGDPGAPDGSGRVLSSTARRAASSDTPSDVRDLAARPSPSWSSPKSRCSVPMNR